MTRPADNEEEIRIPLSHNDMESRDLFALNPPEWLFHYTTLSGTTGILQSKSLWLTKIQYLNDTSELTLAFSLFKEVVQERTGQLGDKEKSEFLKQTA